MYDEGYDPDERPRDPDEVAKLEAADRTGDELLAGQTDRQQEIAGRIYEQLKRGAEVDDIKDLIADLSRTATEDARRRRANQGAQ